MEEGRIARGFRKMLDDKNIVQQRDRKNMLDAAAELYAQASATISLADSDHDDREITSVVIAGMGNFSLAGMIARTIIRDELRLPLTIIHESSLPAYVGKNTLVIVGSDTVEAVDCLRQALQRTCQIAVISAGGELQYIAKGRSIMTASLPDTLPSRLVVITMIRAILEILSAFSLISHQSLRDIKHAGRWLHQESDLWTKSTPTEHNYAKQLALMAVGKTPVFYAGDALPALARKWKISWNETAKNVAFYATLPEANHNDLLGWASHPIEKPFAIFDLVSDFDTHSVAKRFSATDRLLSGRRPKSTVVPLQGSTLVEQALWGIILADFTSIYVAILNNVDPTQTRLLETLEHTVR